MAKNSLPSVDDVPKINNQIALQQVGASYREHVASEGYVSRRVDIKLSREAAIKLRDKTRMLQDTGAKTADGRFVTNKTQAIQWIIENEVNV